jgi:hypothetical protein
VRIHPAVDPQRLKAPPGSVTQPLNLNLHRNREPEPRVMASDKKRFVMEKVKNWFPKYIDFNGAAATPREA